jgi:hypothetical protein
VRRKFGKGDLEDISPIRLLIGKKKDLKLSDEQVNKLKELEGKLKETNEPSRETRRRTRLIAFGILRGVVKPHNESPTGRDKAVEVLRGGGVEVSHLGHVRCIDGPESVEARLAYLTDVDGERAGRRRTVRVGAVVGNEKVGAQALNGPQKIARARRGLKNLVSRQNVALRLQLMLALRA